MDPATHKRFLEYRDRFVYFGKETKKDILGPDDFAAADAEHRQLVAKGDTRDDEEEARFVELSRRLFRD
jgi:hypothetical protein